jgi:hypothetical protein
MADRETPIPATTEYSTTTLDVETPDPPRLRGPQDPGEYEAVDEPDEWTGDESPGEALAAFLEEGAWADAFDEWSGYTALTEVEFEVVRELGLFQAFDVSWNAAAVDVGYRPPELPDDLPAPQGETDEEFDVAAIEQELDALGRSVSEVLETDYIHRVDDDYGFFADAEE